MSEKLKKSLPFLTIITVIIIFSVFFLFKHTLFAQDINGGTPAGITSVSMESLTTDECITPGIEKCVTNDKCLEYDQCDPEKCVRWSEE